MSIGKSTLCLVGLLALCGRRGIAQDAKIEVEEANPLVISGFAVGLGTYDHNLSQSTALASKIAVSFFKPWSDQLYLFGQLTTHVEPQPSGPAETHIELDNLIINWTPAKVSALSLSFGRFDAPVGFERDDEPLNLVPTSSFTLETARPVKFTGLMARYTLSPKVSLLGLVANGWDQETDNNRGKTAGFKLQLFPSTMLAVAGGVFYGPEQDFIDDAQRLLLTGDATWQPFQRLIVQAEAHHATEQDRSWTAAIGQTFFRVGRSTALTLRGDLVDDPDGVRTGTPGKLSSITISPWYFYREAQEGVFSNVEFTTFRLPAFSIRPALRIDHSDQPVFTKRDGSLARSNVTALVEFVFVF